uniref:Uncharacterized protein n=1 Tax=Arundo donax TaxID=35708 RepID=A0A0A9F7B6_ARUDO
MVFQKPHIPFHWCGWSKLMTNITMQAFVATPHNSLHPVKFWMYFKVAANLKLSYIFLVLVHLISSNIGADIGLVALVVSVNI